MRIPDITLAGKEAAKFSTSPSLPKPYDQVTGGTTSLTVTEIAIPFALYLLIYLSTISKVPSVATDSIQYINHIDASERFFHAHHLLYNSFAWMWIAFWRQLGVHTDSALLVSGLNAIFGALTLCVFYSVLRVRLGCDRLTAFLGTSLPAFSFSFWYYSGCVEVYIIPLFLLWVCFYILTGDHVGEKTFALVGFLNGLAVVLAQMSVLFAPVVFLAAWYAHRRGDLGVARSLRNYVLVAMPTAVIPYWAALLYVGRASSFKSAWAWLTLYANQPQYWSAPSFTTVVKAGAGLGQAFLGGHFIFAIPGARAWLERMLQGFYMTNEVYLVRNLGKGVAYLLVALSVALFLIVVTSLAAGLGHWSRLSSKKQALVYLLLVWTLAYTILVVFYTAVNAKLWIAQTLCLWMIFFVLLLGLRTNRGKSARSSEIILAVAVVLTFLVNFMGSIRFTLDKSNDYYYSRVGPLLSVSKQGDLIVIGTAWKFQPYLRRYGKASILSLTSVYRTSGASPESVQQVQSAIDHELAAGGKVVISGEALSPEKETIQRYPGITIFGTVWDRYRQRWHEIQAPTGVVYVLQQTPRNSTPAANPSTGVRK